MSQGEPIPSFIATKDEYKTALKRVRDNEQLTENMLVMLRFQHKAVSQTATATELAISMGYKTYNPANRQYGELGKLIAEALNHTPCKRADGSYRYWTSLSTGDPDREEGEHFRFIMRPELAAALEEMRWCP